MGVKCRVCKKWMTPKFLFWRWFLLFLFIPPFFWWFLPALGYLVYGLFIVLAAIGFFRRCPFCNTPLLTWIDVLSKLGMKPPQPRYHLIKKEEVN